jgi:cbb3-type cytochrome oxidase maturation protein
MDVTLYLFVMALLMGLAAWCIFLWAIRSGQFKDVEDIKYQVFPRPDEDTGVTPPAPPP